MDLPKPVWSCLKAKSRDLITRWDNLSICNEIFNISEVAFLSLRLFGPANVKCVEIVQISV